MESKELAKQIIEERAELWIQGFSRLMKSEQLKPFFDMMSPHLKAEICGHAASGFIVGYEAQIYFRKTGQ